MCYAITPKTGGKVAFTFDYLEDAITFALPQECIVEGAFLPGDYIDSATIGIQRSTGLGLVLDGLGEPWEC
jgi:hypothetical protein